jgi:soluble lytic murein transglycosylase-like protein
MLSYSNSVSFPQTKPMLLFNQLSKQYVWLKNEQRFFHTLYFTAQKYKIDVRYVCAIIHLESYDEKYRPTLKQMQYARSPKDARGLMQVMPVHYDGDPKDLYGITLNLNRGCWYLRKCLVRAHGNPKQAARLYNAGINNHEKHYRNWKKYAIPVAENFNKSLAVNAQYCPM